MSLDPPPLPFSSPIGSVSNTHRHSCSHLRRSLSSSPVSLVFSRSIAITRLLASSSLFSPFFSFLHLSHDLSSAISDGNSPTFVSRRRFLTFQLFYLPYSSRRLPRRSITHLFDAVLWNNDDTFDRHNRAPRAMIISLWLFRDEGTRRRLLYLTCSYESHAWNFLSNETMKRFDRRLSAILKSLFLILTLIRDTITRAVNNQSYTLYQSILEFVNQLTGDRLPNKVTHASQQAFSKYSRIPSTRI